MTQPGSGPSSAPEEPGAHLPAALLELKIHLYLLYIFIYYLHVLMLLLSGYSLFSDVLPHQELDTFRLNLNLT